MSENSSDDDFTPVFAFRADNIIEKQREAYLEMVKKSQEEDAANNVEDEEKELLGKIQEKLQRKPRGRKKACALSSSVKNKEEIQPLKRSTRRRKKLIDEDINEAEKDKKCKMEELPNINLPAATKKKLLKMDLENKMERKRIEKLNKLVLSSCASSSVDDQNISMEVETEQNVTLRINYLADVSNITVGQKEKFSSINSKVADLFKLKIAEIVLCLRDEIISFDETPSSLNVKAWEIIDCLPYKPVEKMQDEVDSTKILIRLQSNDCKKKYELHAHKLEKFQGVMEQYANLRKLPLKDLIFEFDGEKISESDTPDGLDMEDESIVDVKVIGSSLKPAKPPLIRLDSDEEEPPHKMLDICVLD